jgi:hypothetical protein
MYSYNCLTHAELPCIRIDDNKDDTDIFIEMSYQSVSVGLFGKYNTVKSSGNVSKYSAVFPFMILQNVKK